MPFKRHRSSSRFAKKRLSEHHNYYSIATAPALNQFDTYVYTCFEDVIAGSAITMPVTVSRIKTQISPPGQASGGTYVWAAFHTRTQLKHKAVEYPHKRI